MKDQLKKNWFAKHKILTALLILFVIGIIGSATSSSKSNTTTAKTSATTAQATSSKPTTSKIGQAASDGKFEFTVTSLKCGESSISDSTGYLTKTAQGQYCSLNVSVKNVGNEAQTLDSSSQYLFNSAGQKYSSDDEATIEANPSNGTFLNTINPGNTVTGTIVFDVPKSVTPVTAELHDSAFSGGVKINLQ